MRANTGHIHGMDAIVSCPATPMPAVPSPAERQRALRPPPALKRSPRVVDAVPSGAGAKAHCRPTAEPHAPDTRHATLPAAMPDTRLGRLWRPPGSVAADTWLGDKTRCTVRRPGQPAARRVRGSGRLRQRHDRTRRTCGGCASSAPASTARPSGCARNHASHTLCPPDRQCVFDGSTPYTCHGGTLGEPVAPFAGKNPIHLTTGGRSGAIRGAGTLRPFPVAPMAPVLRSPRRPGSIPRTCHLLSPAVPRGGKTPCTVRPALCPPPR